MSELVEREVRVLFRKEWRQLVASKSALLTSLLLPIFLLGIAPFSMFATAHAPAKPHAPTPKGLDFGFFGEVGNDPKQLPIAMLPLMVSMTALVIPLVLTTHLVITERERRTLELLVALPVRIEQVMKAKLAAVLIATSAVTVPLVAIDMVLVVVSGTGTFRNVGGLPILLVCVLAFSTTMSLLVALLARDFRTANNVTGMLMVPSIFVTLGGGMLLPGGWVRPLVLAAVYLVGALIIGRIALRVVTFERLLS